MIDVKIGPARGYSKTAQFASHNVIRASDSMKIGYLNHYRRGYTINGWRFNPFNPYDRQWRPSRKSWPTAQDALRHYKLKIVEGDPS